MRFIEYLDNRGLLQLAPDIYDYERAIHEFENTRHSDPDNAKLGYHDVDQYYKEECNHEHATWNETKGGYVCDKCNERVPILSDTEPKSPEPKQCKSYPCKTNMFKDCDHETCGDYRPIGQSPDADGCTEMLRKNMDYSISLQRAIEHHCGGKYIPVEIAAHCPHHAEMLNHRLVEVNKTITPDADGWVKVEDEVPDYEDWVLLFDGETHYVGRRMEDYEGFYDYENAEVHSVTHWMKLPELPRF